MLAIALLESETERRAERFRVAVPDGTENRGIHSGTVARAPFFSEKSLIA